MNGNNGGWSAYEYARAKGIAQLQCTNEALGYLEVS